MVAYKCARCKQLVEIGTNIRCPYCGHRILFKVPAEPARKNPESAPAAEIGQL